MPSTPGGLVYPAATDDPDVPADLQALAESMEAGNAWSTSTAGFTAGANFSITSVRHRRIGPFVDLTVVMARTTSALTIAAGDGNITNVTLLSAIPAGLIPTGNVYGHSGGAGRAAVFLLTSAGVLELAAVAGDGTNVANGDSLSAHFFYPLG